jgi:hypothetical protein
LYTIKWTGLVPKEDGWSPPSDTRATNRTDVKSGPRCSYSLGSGKKPPRESTSKRAKTHNGRVVSSGFVSTLHCIPCPGERLGTRCHCVRNIDDRNDVDIVPVNELRDERIDHSGIV